MGMSIRTNIAALNAENSLNNNQSMLNKSLQRLSSGYRINNASDDASGQSISDGLQSQVNGLNQAARNGADGTSMLQTADGGMTAIDNMLQRMRELAVQGANGDLGTNDQTAISDEMVQLQSQINNISTSTQFNGLNLLNGNLSTQVAASSAVNVGTASSAASSITAIDTTSAQGGTVYALSASTTPGSLILTNNTTLVTQTVAVGTLAAGGTENINFNQLGVSFQISSAAGDTGNSIAAGLAIAGNIDTAAGSGSVTLQVGANNATDNQIGVSFTNFQVNTSNASGAGAWSGLATALTTFQTDIGLGTGQTGAQAMITAVDTALTALNTQRSAVGAQENRVSYAIANVNSEAENLTSAQSTIKDVDVAAESANMSAATVLVQAGVSVLSQANQTSQLALKLLG